MLSMIDDDVITRSYVQNMYAVSPMVVVNPMFVVNPRFVVIQCL